MNKLRFNRNYIKYGCASEHDYNLVREQREQFNYKVWRIVSGLAAIYFLALFITTFSVEVVRVNAVVDAVLMLIMFAGCALLCTVVKPDSKWLMPVVYTICGALLAFGIMIGVILSPEYLAVTYHVLLIALPLIVVDKPYRMGILEIAASIVFSALCMVTKTSGTRSLDIYNVVVFAVLSQFINYYMVNTKILQFLTARKIEIASYTDDLTQLYNRKAYEKDILEPIKETRFVYVAFDVNGLKAANDDLGHAAGDELLKGAAACIQQCFAPYGKAYRTGGDEFAAMICVSDAELERVMAEFRNTFNDWSGALVHTLSVAAGYTTAEEFPGMSVVEMAKIADQRMYDEKAEYYRLTGISRRR